MSQRFPRTSAVAAAGMLLALHLSCGPKSTSKRTVPEGAAIAAQPAGDAVLVQDESIPDGLAIRLSEGEARAPRGAHEKVVRATGLSAAVAQGLLARMNPIKSAADDKKDFALRERSQPPPRTGETITTPFPPPPSKAKAPSVAGQSTKLEVLRFAPEGDVPLAPHVAVTFSQPMVAVTSHADTVAHGVPVKLTPQPAGNWRWVGTRTLLFDPEVRFPQATEYHLEIPAGIKSANGDALDKAVSWTFTTPAPRVKQSYPTSSPQPRDPMMFVAFDQKIDSAAVLATIRVKAGGKSYPVRAATMEEIRGSAEIKSLVDAADEGEQKGRYVVFLLDQLLPVDTHVSVNIGPGTPSAEGPRKTTSQQSFSFRTYGPLKIEEARCSWGKECPPLTPWFVRFSNPIDDELFDDSTFRVAPKLPGFKAELHERYLYTRGQSKGRTTYTVTVPASLTDKFGQTLGKDEELTFRVGSARPRIWGPQGLVVLDPAAKKQTYDLFSINFDKLEVQIYAVSPKDWAKYAAYMKDYDRYGRHPKPPGRKVVDTVMTVDGAKDEMAETHIDLSPALSGGLGHAVVVVKPTPWNQRYSPPTLNAWVESTHLALDAFVDGTELIAWATHLSDGKPAANVRLEILPHGSRAATDATGVARIPLSAKRYKAPNLLYAVAGKDTAFLPENTYWWSDWGGWTRNEPGESLRWFVFDDRHMYRPGEEVHLKGWLRRIDYNEGGDVSGLHGAVTSVDYQLFGPRGNKLLTGKADVSAAGGFDTAFTLPKTPNLGYARVVFRAEGKAGKKLDGRTFSHNFQIQEFRRPEFEVSASASQGPHLVGSSANVTVKAKYYAGGGLPNANVSWRVTSTVGSFTPPNRSEYTFGTFVPWWRYWDHPNDKLTTRHFQGKTDATGKHVLEIDFLSVKPPRPMSVVAQASVTDVNRQQWAATATLLVHPSELYVGLKTDKMFVEKGQPLEIQAITVNHDGEAVLGRAMSLRAVRMDWTYKKGKYITEEKDPQECKPTSEKDPSTCTFATAQGGQYKITAVVVDDKGRPNETELSVWVSGGERPPAREVEQEEATLIPDKKNYKPGDTAEILVQSPFHPAQGLLSIRRSGIVSTERFDMNGPTTTLKVPITDAYTPNLFVQVDLVGAAPRLDDKGKVATNLPERPAYAKGMLNLAVPPVERTLKVVVKPRAKKIEPGGKTSLDIRVLDPIARPVANAELAVVVVDESVLALSNYKTPDPLAVFYSERSAGGRDHHLRERVALAKPDEETLGQTAATATGEGYGRGAGGDATAGLMDDDDGGYAEAEETAAAPMDLAPAKPMLKAKAARTRNGGGGGHAQAPIAVRIDFNALAVFAPEVRTGADGRATVPVKVPDNLTRYRVMVVAVEGERRFGNGESAITARMPLMVRPSPPRFLNFGDRFELPVVLQNQTDEKMKVQVAVRTSNAQLTGDLGKELEVPANDRVEVRFPAAAEMPGTARFQVAASSNRWADAAEFALPVWTPATTEAFATYGEIDRGAVKQPVALPGKVVEQFGGLEITTSSTQLQALTDAFLYLVAYPFECAEQLSSRVLAVAALRDVLTAFKADGLPKPKELEAAVSRDLKRLQGLQNYDGGWGFWRRGEPSWPFVSIHVAHALTRAEEKGFAVPGNMIDRAKRYLRNIESNIPGYYPIEVRRTLIAYALYVRNRMGDRDIARAQNLLYEGKGIKERSLEAVGWILGVLAKDKGSRKELRAIHRHLQNRVVETAAAANFTTSYSDGAHLLLHSSRRVDGIILESLINDTPKSDLIAKIVRGLLAHRTRGRWSNTQENAFVLLALDRYFNVYEKVTPNFVARVWLGDAFAGEHKFKGRTTDRKHIDIPMPYLAKVKKADLVLSKTGKGRLYYRVGMTYAPASLKLAPADHGFAVERAYEAVDDPSDVKRMSDGTWKIKAGTRVRVRLTMVAENRRYHVALVDPLPAGLEPMNPALAVTGAVPQDPSQSKGQGRYWWWWRTWYEHQNMRDERVEAFTSLLWEGVHTYSYVTRATTPGNFVVPPTKAEEMYFPETFGRSGSDRVIVE